MKRRIVITETEDGVDIDICFIKSDGSLTDYIYKPNDFGDIHRLLHEARHETVKRIKQEHNQRLGGNSNG